MNRQQVQVLMSSSSLSTPFSVTKTFIVYGKEYTVRTLVQEDVVDVKVLNDILFPIKYGDNFYKLLTREANVSSSPSAARMVHPNTDKILTNGYWTILVFSDSDQMIDEDLSGCTSDVAGAKAPVGCSVRPCHRLVGASTFKVKTEHQICGRLKYNGYLATFGIAPDQRKRGLGERLLNITLQEMVHHGCDFIELHVKSDNHGAIKLYTKAGINVIESLPGFYAIDGAYHDALRMRSHDFAVTSVGDLTVQHCVSSHRPRISPQGVVSSQPRPMPPLAAFGAGGDRTDDVGEGAVHGGAGIGPDASAVLFENRVTFVSVLGDSAKVEAAEGRGLLEATSSMCVLL